MLKDKDQLTCVNVLGEVSLLWQEGITTGLFHTIAISDINFTKSTFYKNSSALKTVKPATTSLAYIFEFFVQI